MKQIKQLFGFIIGNLLLINSVFGATRTVGDSSIKDSLIGVSNDNITDGASDNGLSMLSEILIWTKDQITGIVVVIAIGVFLYIGAKLAISRGNPEEFKKAIMQLVYAIVGIFIVAAAWALVTLVAGIDL